MNNRLQYQYDFNRKANTLLLAFLLCIFVFSLVGCKSGTALRHYKKVAAETQLPLTPEKKNALATACLREFPIEQKTITKDSIVYKPIKVIDNTKINQLKKEIERLKTLTPNVNLDSLYQSFYDSVLNDLPECKEVEHYRTTEDKSKDTIGNYFRQLEYNEIKKLYNQSEADNVILINKSKDLVEQLHQADNKIDKWFWRFVIACVLGIGSWLVYGYFKLKSSYKLPI